MKPGTLLLAAVAMAASAHAADWNDTSVGLRIGNQFAEPGIDKKIGKTILAFNHIDGDKLGTNLFVIDLLMSDSKDPSQGGGGNAQEWYGFYQRTFSMSALTGNKGGYGFAKDLSLVARVDFGTKNTEFAPRPRKLRLGVSAAMPVSAGFWDVGVQLYKETNHNGIVGKDVSFDLAPVLTSAWAIPAGPGTFGGFFDLVGQKGKDGFGGKTKAEVLARLTYLFDIGAKTGLKAGVGYEYWNNKFGNPASSVPGSKQSTAMLMAEYHF